MSPQLALHVLGSPKLDLDNAPIPIYRRKSLALLAYLSVNRGPYTRLYQRLVLARIRSGEGIHKPAPRLVGDSAGNRRWLDDCLP